MKTRFNLTKTLALSALVAVFFAPSALIAADDDEADVEEIVVTGSRIKRDSINSAQVITTITAQDIEQSQALITADALRLSTYNTFGSFPSTAGNSAMSNTTISLRGTGWWKNISSYGRQKITGFASFRGFWCCQY